MLRGIDALLHTLIYIIASKSRQYAIPHNLLPILHNFLVVFHSFRVTIWYFRIMLALAGPVVELIQLFGIVVMVAFGCILIGAMLSRTLKGLV
jgi:hypothetical protein